MTGLPAGRGLRHYTCHDDFQRIFNWTAHRFRKDLIGVGIGIAIPINKGEGKL